jgi:hypothetical protein
MERFYFLPEGGCVVLDQPQHVEQRARFWLVRTLRLVSDTAALLTIRIAALHRINVRHFAAKLRFHKLGLSDNFSP